MVILHAIGLYLVTAIAELTGSYLMYLWLRRHYAPWISVLAVLSFIIFGWLLTLHPGAAARTYAAYGGIYVFSSLIWLWLIERQQPTLPDVVGVAIMLIGCMIIILNR